MKALIIALCILLLQSTSYSQGFAPYGKGTVLKLDSTGQHYVRILNWHQVWLRYNENNPGSVVNGEPTAAQWDMALRRSRLIVFTQLSGRTRILTHLGINNQTLLSGGASGQDGKKPPIFIHEATVEHDVAPTLLTLGAGLHYWRGVSRLTNASTVSFLAMDAPILNFFEIDIADQFARIFGIFAKGKLGHLDYRASFNFPFVIRPGQPTSILDTLGARHGLARASFAAHGRSRPGAEAYLMYQFRDVEPNLMPYTAGSWLGTKRVLNVGMGFAYYPHGLWTPRPTPAGWDTLYHAMAHVGVDVFWDQPIGPSRKHALTVYAVYYNYNFGPRYLRHIGIANPAEAPIKGTATATKYTASGPGNSLPTIGTGQAVYAEVGWALPGHATRGRLMPYAALTMADYSQLQDLLLVPDVGVNWFLAGHHAKVTLNYRNRPVFDVANAAEPWGPLHRVTSRSELTCQFQVAL